MRRDGIDLTTLLITAVASAAAAYTCSKIWAPGTLASAAFTPVLVAIIKEALARPTQAVTRAVPVRGVVRSSPPPAEHLDAPAPPEPPPLDRVPQAGEVSYHSTRSSARRWRMAIITGLLGFVIAVLVLTVPELVAGRSASGGGGTTIFGGQQRKQETQTTTAPARTVTVPTPTVTVPAPGNTTSAPAPATTATTPGTTTTTPTSTTPTVTQPPPAQP
jgi:hypothetical protein